MDCSSCTKSSLSLLTSLGGVLSRAASYLHGQGHHVKQERDLLTEHMCVNCANGATRPGVSHSPKFLADFVADSGAGAVSHGRTVRGHKKNGLTCAEGAQGFQIYFGRSSIKTMSDV
jgi:hypothetical protein